MEKSINIYKREKGDFTPDYFIRMLGDNLSFELKEKFSKAIMLFIEKYTYDINYQILDEADMTTTFENIQYFMSFYAYKKDIDVMEELSNVSKFISNSFEFYKETLSNLKEIIEKLYRENPLKNLPEVVVYLERLKITLKLYENLISCNLNTQQLEFMPVTYSGNDYPFFTLVNDPGEGLYDFCELIFDIEKQFEFYSLFNPDDIIRIYQNLNFDVTTAGEEYKYTEILQPILQQYLFCCEYAETSISLKLSEDNIRNIGVDLKIFFTKREVKENYYLLSEEDFKAAIKLINTSEASEYYKSKLITLVKDFRYKEAMCEVGAKVCLKSVLDKLISSLEDSRGYEINFEVSKKLIELLTKNSTSLLYSEDYIDDEYMGILIESLKNDVYFKTLSDPTKEYILKNIPDVRNSLLAFKKMKNLAFVV